MADLKIIKRNANAIQVYAPYEPKFLERMRSLHGTWDKPAGCWWLSATQIPAVREAMRDVFGTDDLSGRNTVSLLLRFEAGDGAYRKDYTLYGKVLSHATGKTSGGTPGTDVTYLQGNPESGGSVENWCSVVPAGSLIRLDNVEKAILDSETLPVHTFLEVLDNADKLCRENLIRERESLMQRVNEIDSLLEKI